MTLPVIGRADKLMSVKTHYKDGTMDHYRLLGIPIDAHPIEIKMAYEALNDPLASDRMLNLELHAAYQTLMDPYERAAYDAQFIGESTTVPFSDNEQMGKDQPNPPKSRDISSIPPSQADQTVKAILQFIGAFIATWLVLAGMLLLR